MTGYRTQTLMLTTPKLGSGELYHSAISLLRLRHNLCQCFFLYRMRIPAFEKSCIVSQVSLQWSYIAFFITSVSKWKGVRGQHQHGLDLHDTDRWFKISFLSRCMLLGGGGLGGAPTKTNIVGFVLFFTYFLLQEWQSCHASALWLLLKPHKKCGDFQKQ